MNLSQEQPRPEIETDETHLEEEELTAVDLDPASCDISGSSVVEIITVSCQDDAGRDSNYCQQAMQYHKTYSNKLDKARYPHQVPSKRSINDTFLEPQTSQQKMATFLHNVNVLERLHASKQNAFKPQVNAS